MHFTAESSGAIKELERDRELSRLKRSSHGTVLTPGGEEFRVTHVRSQTSISFLNRHGLSHQGKEKIQRVDADYSFAAVKAFVELVKQFGADEYEFQV